MGRPADLTPAPIALSPASVSGGSLAAVMTPQFVPAVTEGKKRTPKQLTTFSRTAGEMTDEIPRATWSRRGLRPAYAVAVIAVAVAVVAAIFLLQPTSSPTVAPVTLPVRPSIVTLPAVAPATPEVEPLSPPAVAAKPAEAPSKTVLKRSRSRRVQHRDEVDPFEAPASDVGQKIGKSAASSPSDRLPRNDTGRAGPLSRPKAKRTIIREL